MGGMGGKEKCYMYRLVYESESRKYRFICSSVLKEVCTLLMKKGISAQPILIGSGAQNMITKNGNGPFDLDYNLVIVKAPDKYWNNLHYLKDTVRILLDQAAKSFHFSEFQDSTSCLTAISHFPEKFHLDVAIIKRLPNGKSYRLIHRKHNQKQNNDQYIWNEVPHSRDVAKKALQLKKHDLWLEVRDCYLNLKKRYLSRSQEADHPSFSVYTEAVHQVYNKHFS